jgi:hypothetical protein
MAVKLLNIIKMLIEKTEWTTEEMMEEFKVIGFSSGYCAVERKSNGQVGVLDFGGRPRVYKGFMKTI